ncbi:MAG: HAD hydrolase family protein [Ignavibacteriales bacterium]|nr:HAD hydrolase family protein [Ignavibacteriales bacterium]
MKSEILTKMKEIKIFLFDLEGVLLNDNTIPDKLFDLLSAKIKEFNRYGLKFGIITAREEDDLINKLKSIENCNVISSSLDKVSSADNFLTTSSVDYKNVFYMGDDLLDIPLIKKCRLTSTPINGRREVKRIVDFVSKSKDPENILNEILSLIKKSMEIVAC